MKLQQMTSVRLRPDQLESLRSMADRCDLSVSEYIRSLFDYAILNDIRVTYSVSPDRPQPQLAIS